MSKSILVTGGSGFIGSHIVESLVQIGWKVKVYDNLSSGSLDNLKAVKNDIEFIKGDILDFDTLSRAIKGVEVVSHQAAQLEIFLGIAEPNKDLEINTIGTLNVLRACHQHGVNKLINASSACVYGQAVTPLQSEDHPQNPNWEYGVSKLAAEKYCQIYHETHGMKIASLRYGITYGPREWFRRVMTIFIKRVLSGKPPVIFGAGDAIRDFIYVGDIVNLHNALLEKNLPGHTVLNAGTGIGTSVCGLAMAVCEALEVQMEPIFELVKEGEFSKEVPDKKRNTAELKSMVLDATKAADLVGWKPRVNLVKGIQLEAEWARENIERWERVYSTQW
jgi:UDP-glucose 4-epimerase